MINSCSLLAGDDKLVIFVGQGNSEGQGQADGFVKTSRKLYRSILCVRGLSLRVICCEIRSSLQTLEVIPVREMTLLQCCLLFPFFLIQKDYAFFKFENYHPNLYVCKEGIQQLANTPQPSCSIAIGCFLKCLSQNCIVGLQIYKKLFLPDPRV